MLHQSFCLYNIIQYKLCNFNKNKYFFLNYAKISPNAIKDKQKAAKENTSINTLYLILFILTGPSC